MPTVEFGEWLPDQPDFQNPGSTVITNVIPDQRSYRPFPGPIKLTSNSMVTRPFAAFTAVQRNGDVTTYAGDKDSLYILTDDTLTTLSYSLSGTSSFNVQAQDRWEFTQYGQLVVATQIQAPVQSISAGSSAATSLITSSTKPRARHLATVRDFLVLGNTLESGVRYPQRVRWSAFDNAADFDQSQTTLSGFQDLLGNGGVVQAIRGGEEGIIFQERSIWKMTFIGTPLIWQFDEIQPNRGTIAPFSVIRYGDRVYYIDEDGFYVLNARSGAVQDIGKERVNEFFFNDLDTGNSVRIRSSIDPREGIVVWGYPGANSVSGEISRLLVYSWKVDRWSLVNQTLDDLYFALSQGFTLEELDQFSTSIDTLAFSLDSRVWAGGLATLGGINTSGELLDYDGTPLNATLETKELQAQEGYRQVVTSVRPYVDYEANSVTASTTLQVGVRDTHQQSYSYGPKISLNAIGEAPTRSNGRYTRFRVNLTGNWKHAQGVNVLQQTRAGRR